jgi:hypothetical protein
VTEAVVTPRDTVAGTSPPSNATPRDQLAAEFRNESTKSVAGIIGQGRVCIKAKNQLPHGEFTDWAWEVVSSRKCRDPDVARRKADLLMGLVEDPVISNRCHWHRFPPSPRTLDEIRRIRPESLLLRYIADGSINPGLTREEAIKLKRGRTQPRPPFIVSAAIAHLQRQLDRLTDNGVVANLREDPGALTPDQLKQFARRLTNLAKQWAE